MIKGHRVIRAMPEIQALKVIKERKVVLDRRVCRVSWVVRAVKGLRVFRV